MQGQAVLVTGATSGLGEAAARDFAARGASVIAVGRDQGRGAALLSALRASGKGDHSFHAVDLSSMAALLGFAQQLHPRGRIGLLLNNAGGSFAKRADSPDGIERTFALNVLAPFLLTRALHDQLRGGAVVNVVTGVPKGAKLAVEELASPAKYSALGVYTKAKLALEMLTIEQAGRYPDLRVNCAHPGIIPGTRFGADMPKVMLAIGSLVAKLFGMATTAEAAVACFRAAAEGSASGLLYAKGAPADYPTQAKDNATRDQLWRLLSSF